MSKIEWTGKTWNPVTGCTKISAGCKNCYAETMAKRLQYMGVAGYGLGFKLTTHAEKLNDPYKNRKPTTYFVCSMSDLFHEAIEHRYINMVFDTMIECSRHTFQILTKRSDRLVEYFHFLTLIPNFKPIPNIWVGVSVENREAKERIEHLKMVPAPIRFLSIEPLLEDLGTIDLRGISWVIVGGESGPKARPMKPEWARSVRDQCIETGVPFFFKQWGAWGEDGVNRSKKKNGRLLDGRTWEEMPK